MSDRQDLYWCEVIDPHGMGNLSIGLHRIGNGHSEGMRREPLIRIESRERGSERRSVYLTWSASKIGEERI